MIDFLNIDFYRKCLNNIPKSRLTYGFTKHVLPVTNTFYIRKGRKLRNNVRYAFVKTFHQAKIIFNTFLDFLLSSLQI